MASFSLFDDRPQLINTIEDSLRKVTPELMRKTAQDYLRKTNRTILIVEPAAAQKSTTGGAQ
jgi:predicted Zn-dependent peptidase